MTTLKRVWHHPWPYLLLGVAAVVCLGSAGLIQATPAEVSINAARAEATVTAEDQPPATTQPASGSESKPQPTTKEAAKSTPEDGKKDPPPRREPSATDILRELTKQSQSPKPVLRPATPDRVDRTTVASEAVPTNAVAAPTQRLLPDGYRLVDRPGRLAREGDYWVFSFEDRGQGSPQLPIRLLPNRLLEDMEQFSEGGTKPVVFVVSGEVTEYHGVNYLLVQKLLTRANLGNLK